MIVAIDHLVMTITYLEKTKAFYCDGLGMRFESFTPAQGGAPRHALVFGTQKINLHDVRNPHTPHAAQPNPGAIDICFLTEQSLDVWRDHLTAQHIPIEAGPVARTGATGPIESLYLRDPDGNLVEIAVQTA